MRALRAFRTNCIACMGACGLSRTPLSKHATPPVKPLGIPSASVLDRSLAPPGVNHILIQQKLLDHRPAAHKALKVDARCTGDKSAGSKPANLSPSRIFEVLAMRCKACSITDRSCSGTAFGTNKAVQPCSNGSQPASSNVGVSGCPANGFRHFAPVLAPVCLRHLCDHSAPMQGLRLAPAPLQNRR